MTPFLTTTVSQSNFITKKYFIYLFNENDYNNLKGFEILDEITYFLGNSIEMNGSTNNGSTNKITRNDEKFLYSIGIHPDQVERILEDNDYLIITSDFI